MTKWKTKEQLIKLLCNLVEIPSITGSEAERKFPDYIIGELSSLEYFQKHPENIRKYPTGDGRSFVTGLVKKNHHSKKTVILISHFDVVDVEDYGRWKEEAFHPEKLKEQFLRHKDELPKQVRQDIETGNWLFGRGTMDMKCGLALHMAMLEQATEGGFDGNILLLTVPDEEANSVGMRAAVSVLLELANEHELEYTAVLNGEPMFMRYPGDQTKYIYTGSIGKVLAGFLCYGKETHVGEPFAGLNGNYMASFITSELELNTDFCEQVENERTPPPSNLIQYGLKKGYSVQIPHRAVTLFNLFLLNKTMGEVMDDLREKAETVAEKIVSSYKKQIDSYSKDTYFPVKEMNISIKTYEELMNYAQKTYGEDIVNQLITSIVSNRGDMDDREVTIKIADELTILCKELAPLIVLFFAPPFYPAITSYQHPLIKEVVTEILDYSKEFHDISFEKINYFSGISDLSYAGLQYPAAYMKPLTSNMPLWNNGYKIPIQELEQLNLPVLNLGPVGFDAHQWTERLDVDYAFGVLLDILPVCISLLLKKNDRSIR